MSQVWRVRLAQQAELDFVGVLQWTADHFGAIQASRYAETVNLSIEALTAGPGIVGVKARDDLAPGIKTLHVAQHGRKGRHFVVFREAEGQIIEVLRLLHDSMDLSLHRLN